MLPTVPPPLARTPAEAHLYMDIRPCETCGERGFSGASAVVYVDGELCSQYTGTCPRCGGDRRFVFRLPDEPWLPLERDVAFGGPAPSELLDAGEWLIVADLASGRPQPDDADLALAAAAIDEVLKFIPDGADAVPPEAIHTEDGRQAYEREPGRFRRTRLAAVAATYRELGGQPRLPGGGDG
jgi:hypothetical protein